MARKKHISLRRRVSYKLGGALLTLGMFFARLLPLKSSDWLGARLGRVGFKLNRKHRTRALANLTMCFPEWSQEQIQKTAIKVFEHFGKTAMRFLSSVKMTDEQVLKTVSRYDDTVLRTALSEGKGVLLLGGHFGNWERGAHVLTLLGYEVAVVARDANDARTTEKINKRRRSRGLEVLSRGNAAKDVLRALKANKIVAILPDQNARESFVPFFGFPAGTVTGPAVLCQRTGAPILFSTLVEREDGTYEGMCIRLDLDGLTGNREEDERIIMTRFNAELEAAIRKHPEQWLWMHDRWKAAREQGLLNG